MPEAEKAAKRPGKPTELRIRNRRANLSRNRRDQNGDGTKMTHITRRAASRLWRIRIHPLQQLWESTEVRVNEKSTIKEQVPRRFADHSTGDTPSCRRS